MELVAVQTIILPNVYSYHFVVTGEIEFCNLKKIKARNPYLNSWYLKFLSNTSMSRIKTFPKELLLQLKPTPNLPIFNVDLIKLTSGVLNRDKLPLSPIPHRLLPLDFVPFFHSLTMIHIQPSFKCSDIRIWGYSETQCLFHRTVGFCFTLW